MGNTSSKKPPASNSVPLLNKSSASSNISLPISARFPSTINKNNKSREFLSPPSYNSTSPPAIRQYNTLNSTIPPPSSYNSLLPSGLIPLINHESITTLTINYKIYNPHGLLGENNKTYKNVPIFPYPGNFSKDRSAVQKQIQAFMKLGYTKSKDVRKGKEEDHRYYLDPDITFIFVIENPDPKYSTNSTNKYLTLYLYNIDKKKLHWCDFKTSNYENVFLDFVPRIYERKDVVVNNTTTKIIETHIDTWFMTMPGSINMPVKIERDQFMFIFYRNNIQFSLGPALFYEREHKRQLGRENKPNRNLKNSEIEKDIKEKNLIIVLLNKWLSGNILVIASGGRRIRYARRTHRARKFRHICNTRR